MGRHNDLTFFTNEDGETLDKRFNKILSRNTQFFDALVGYFRMSGFHLIEEALEHVEHTRILVGINADEETIEAYKEANGQVTLESLNSAQTIDKYKKNIINEFENSDDTLEVEKGISKLGEMIAKNKVEIRVYTKQPIHAKVYIMRDYDDSTDYGRVITGSSNFSHSGLVSNLEFNVELKNPGDVDFALEKFEMLWKESVDVTDECIDTIKNNTWIKEDITPYEMYVKFLYEYFKEEINDDKESENIDKVYPDGFKPLQYQRDAVIQARRILEKHNGVFISDVVGLGKTFICSMIAQELQQRKLFLVPPVLIDYWKETLNEFGVTRYKVESTGKLKEIVENDDISKYSYIFIDEAHKFRNDETESYKMLHQICHGKKVILITATPQNNYNSDIAHQLYLFESKRNSTIPDVRNLEKFFDDIRKRENQFDKKSIDYAKTVVATAQLIRDRILREVMIRRTRTEIQRNYEEDLKKQGLKFPSVSDPQKMIYVFDKETDDAFDFTIDKIKELKYSRYKPLTYVNKSALTPTQRTLLIGQENLGGFMKGVLVKRLESSKFAFINTLERFIKSYKLMIEMYKTKGYVVISKKIDVNDLFEKNDIDRILVAIEKEDATQIKASDLNPKFIKEMNEDLEILEELYDRWITIKSDNKFEYFAKLLKEDKNLAKSKILIFTEAAETAEYLKEQLEKEFNEKILLFTGSSTNNMRNIIKANFDPNYNKEKQSNEYRILVTTDVLAEGMNLHRSNIIFNYDLPWNPTRVMQRVGRINRVGTKFDKIFIYNFFPTSKSDEQVSVAANIMNKIQRIHNMLGEDSKYLTDEEEVDTFELFKKMNSLTEEDETDSELSYLKKIRDIRDNDKELFEKVKKLPKKIKIGREPKKESKGVLTFFRKGYLKKFFVSLTDGISVEVNFENAINMVEANKNEKAKKVSSIYYDLLNKNKKMFVEVENEIKDEGAINANRKGGSNANSISSVLKIARKDTALTNEEILHIDDLINLLKHGELPAKILKEGNALIKKIDGIKYSYINYYKDFARMIPKTYMVVNETNKQTDNSNEIVLSEIFE